MTHSHEYFDKKKTGTSLFTCKCGFHTEIASEFKTHIEISFNALIPIEYDPNGEVRTELRKK